MTAHIMTLIKSDDDPKICKYTCTCGYGSDWDGIEGMQMIQGEHLREVKKGENIKIMATIIKVDGRVESIELVKGNAQLDQLQEIVSGFVEQLRLDYGDEMYMNEDGQRLKLKFNKLASEIAKREVVGDVLIAYPGEVY